MPLALRHRHQESTFERLYRAHVGDVYRYAYALTGNRADAEDVTQTTFMNAYRAFERGERPMKPRNWLVAIAHNVCRERFRRAARQPAQVVFDEDVAEALVPSDDTPSASDIQRALGYLAYNQREALVLRELEGRSYAEIATMLNLSVSAVETLIFRARRALREQLEGSLTCAQAEAALSRQLDGRLPRKEQGPLRAHLRACEDCSRLARRQRAQRKALGSLALLPLPTTLAHWGGGGAAGVGAAAAGGVGASTGAVGGAGVSMGAAGLSAGVAVKAAAVAAGLALAAGGSYAVVDATSPGGGPHPATGTTTGAVVPAAHTGTSAPGEATTTAHGHSPAAASQRSSSRPAGAPPGRQAPPAGSHGATASGGASASTKRSSKPSTTAKTKKAHTSQKKAKKQHAKLPSGCGVTAPDPSQDCRNPAPGTPRGDASNGGNR